MHVTSLLRLAATAVCSAISIWAQANNPWAYIAPGSDSITAMEWRKVLNSPFRDLLRREIPTQDLQVLNGINFIEGIDRVVLARSGGQLLVVLNGNFDRGHLREMAVGDGGTVKPYKRAELLLSSDAEADSQIALVNDYIILLGGKDAITRSLDRLSSKPSPALANHDLWLYTRNPSPEIDKSDIGFDLRSGIHVEGLVNATSPDIAHKIEDSARLMELATTHTGNQIHVEGQLDRAGFERRSGQWRITLEQLAAVHPPENAEASQQQVPQGPQTIRIVGLDDGVREVQLGAVAPGTPINNK